MPADTELMPPPAAKIGGFPATTAAPALHSVSRGAAPSSARTDDGGRGGGAVDAGPEHALALVPAAATQGGAGGNSLAVAASVSNPTAAVWRWCS